MAMKFSQRLGGLARKILQSLVRIIDPHPDLCK
jgi:hypothetical protein